MVGFETALPLSYTALVRPAPEHERACRKMSARPAEILKIDKGRLAEGK